MTDAMTLASAARGATFRAAPVADSLKGSEILRIAAEIRALVSAGERVCNLTVGDFDPRQFPVPRVLRDATVKALQSGETNYPPSAGMPALRESVRLLYERELGLSYAVDSVLITAGSRPGVYGTYRAIVGRGDRVVYGVPSWNNNYYTHMVEGRDAPVVCTPATSFLPAIDSLQEALRGARLLALNSPLNPSGTAFSADALGAICDLVLEENARRSPEDDALYVLYDQVYWQLTFGGTNHVDPVSLRPDIVPFTIFVDGISKCFAATGMRVGWVVGPASVISVMNNILGHVGTWAPRAEQVATAQFLDLADEITTFRAEHASRAQVRLGALYRGIQEMRALGLPVDAITPMGAIYLSVRFDLAGRRTREGKELHTADDVRRWLLGKAGMAVVPFDAFGAGCEDGWFRLSVGAVSVEEIEEALPRLRAGLEELS